MAWLTGLENIQAPPGSWNDTETQFVCFDHIFLWISPVNWFTIMNETILHDGSPLRALFNASVYAAALFVH